MLFTNHETRITAFYRVLRPSGGEKGRLVIVSEDVRTTTGQSVWRTEGFDRAGMVVSISCGLHCALTPLLAGFAVTSSLGWVFGETTELWLLGGAVAIGLLSLCLGYWLHHRHNRCFGWFFAGVTLLLFAKLGPAGEGLEPWAVGAGAIAIAVAHAVNIRLCRSCADCPPERAEDV